MVFNGREFTYEDLPKWKFLAQYRKELLDEMVAEEMPDVLILNQERLATEALLICALITNEFTNDGDEENINRLFGLLAKIDSVSKQFAETYQPLTAY